MTTATAIISTTQNKAIDQYSYDVDADINRSGKITLADSALYSAKTALASGFVSELGSGNPDSPVSWVGYLYNYEGDVYTVRNRWTASSLGRWIERDPLRYIDGQGMYQYAKSGPVTHVDPSGLGPSINNVTDVFLDPVYNNYSTGICGGFVADLWRNGHLGLINQPNHSVGSYNRLILNTIFATAPAMICFPSA